MNLCELTIEPFFSFVGTVSYLSKINDENDEKPIFYRSHVVVLYKSYKVCLVRSCDSLSMKDFPSVRKCNPTLSARKYAEDRWTTSTRTVCLGMKILKFLRMGNTFFLIIASAVRIQCLSFISFFLWFEICTLPRLLFDRINECSQQRAFLYKDFPQANQIRL